MKASIFDSLINSQILRQENTDEEKKSVKKREERCVDNEIQSQVALELSETQTKHRKQRSLMAKMTRAAEQSSHRDAKTQKSAPSQKADLLKNTAESKKTESSQKSLNSTKAKLCKNSLKKPRLEVKVSEVKDPKIEAKIHPAVEHMIVQYTTKMLMKDFEFVKPELEDLEFLEAPVEEIESQENAETSSNASSQTKKTLFPHKATLSKTPKAVQKHLSKLSPQEKKEYVSKILNGSSLEILDTLLDPKHLIGCTLTQEQLNLLKKQSKEKARSMRKAVGYALPSALRLAKKYSSQGHLGEVGKGLLEDVSEKESYALSQEKSSSRKSSSSHKKPATPKKENANEAIFAAMAESLDLTGLLEKMGLKTQMTEINMQAVTAKQEVSEAAAQAEKIDKQIEQNAEQSKCQQVIKVLTMIIAVLLCALGQPEAGLLMLAASTGLLDMIIQKLASAMHIPQADLKLIIVIIAIIIAIVAANPGELLDSGEEAVSACNNCVSRGLRSFVGSASNFEAFSAVMMVAGSTGFLTDLLGACATGQWTDESKYPSWVGWAAMGISVAVMLPDLVSVGYRACLKLGEKLAARAAQEAITASEAAQVGADVAKGTERGIASEEGSIGSARSSSNVTEPNEAVEESNQGESQNTDPSEASSSSDSDSTQSTENSAGGRQGSSAQNGVDGAPQPVSGESTTPVEGDSSDVSEPIEQSQATEAITSTPQVSEPVLNSTSQVNSKITARSGSTVQEETSVSGSARTLQSEVTQSAEDGEDSEHLAVTSLNGATRGAESWGANDIGNPDDLPETDTEAKDPFKEKLEKAEKALQKAQRALERLRLEDAEVGTQTEEALEIASQTEKAEMEVQRLEAETQRLRQIVKAQRDALRMTAAQLREAERVAQELENLPERSEEEETLLSQAKKAADEFKVKLDKLEKTEQELSDAEDRVASAKKNLESWKQKLQKSEASESRVSRARRFLNSNLEKLGKIAMVAANAGEVYAQVQLAEIDRELGEGMAEIAALTGDMELLSTFYEIMGTAVDNTKQRNQEYSQDLHNEIQLIGDIIRAEKRASNALMTA